MNELGIPDIKFPVVKEVSLEELEDSRLSMLNVKQQRFCHLYLSGEHTLKDIATLLNMSVPGIRKWLMNPQVKAYIEAIQKEEDEIVTQGLKALRIKALTRLNELMDSNIDGVALTAVDRVLDRTGHKAPTKQEIDVTVKTFEQQIIELANTTNAPIDVTDYKVIKED